MSLTDSRRLMVAIGLDMTEEMLELARRNAAEAGGFAVLTG